MLSIGCCKDGCNGVALTPTNGGAGVFRTGVVWIDVVDLRWVEVAPWKLGAEIFVEVFLIGVCNKLTSPAGELKSGV